MKIKLLVAAAATVVASSAMAASAFEGFYGQIATGYENNQASNLGGAGTYPGNPNDTWNANNQSFGGAPLVVGLGWNYSVAPQWVVGLGVDYSAISQKSSTYSSTSPNAGNAGLTITPQTLEVSNRINIFITPGYEIEKDKLVYLKAGYSSLTEKYTPPPASSSSPSLASSTSTVGGYVAGLGYKQIITGGFYGFAEGNYMSYSKPTFSSSYGTTGYKIVSSPSVNSYQLLVGVGYKF